MTSSNPTQAEMEKLFQELTDCIVFLGEEGYGFTQDRLMAIRDGFRSLQAENAKLREALEECKKEATYAYAAQHYLHSPSGLKKKYVLLQCKRIADIAYKALNG